MAHIKLTNKKSLINIYIINSLAVFIYAIMFSSLTVYLTDSLGFETVDAENTVGLFLALNFILHLLAGYMGGRFLTNRQILIITIIVELIGICILSNTIIQNAFLGLSMVVVGCGLNTTSLQCILNSKFDKNDSNRERAFFLMYSALNVGFLMGFSFAGYHEIDKSFVNMYFICAMVSLLAFVWAGLSWNSLSDGHEVHHNKDLKKSSNMLGFFIIVTLVTLCDLAFKYSAIANNIVLGIGLTSFISIIILANKDSTSQGKDGLIAFFILTFFSVIFWAMFYIGPLGGIIFLEQNVQLHLFGLNVAPQWLMNLNSVFIILGSPILGVIIIKLRSIGFRISIPRQFLFSLLFISLSYFIYSIGIYFGDSNGKTSIAWVVLHFLFQATGELLIAPVGYAMVGQLIAKKYQSYMMGIWMMVGGISVELSNIFSHHMISPMGTDQISNNSQYIRVFNILSVSTCLLALALLLSLGFLERLVNSASNPKDSTKLRNKSYKNSAIYVN